MKTDTITSIGLLILRAATGCYMFFTHGLDKINRFAAIKDSFPDPIGLGHTLSAVLATAAEAGTSLLLILGLGTRLAAIPLAFTMAVAFLVIHADDPWQKKELAVVYFTIFVTLILLGGGRFSCDTLIRRKRSARLKKPA